jgi:CubicO group peptidase (beta-lactamase class C family)
MKGRYWQMLGFFFVGFGMILTGVVGGQNSNDGRAAKNAVKNKNAAAPIVRGGLGAALDEYLRRLEGYGFSGSLLVAKDGEIFLAKGYGLADRARSVPVSAATVFYSASIAKQFTAAAVMLLEQRGKLRVEDPIERYFDNVPEDKKQITLHQILTHSAGFPNEFSRAGMDFYKNADEYYYKNREEYVRAILAAPLDFKPGSDTGYSNAGFSLIAAIVEKASGQSYRSFVRQNLFIPAGLTHTGFGDDAKKWNQALVAKGFNGSVEIPHSYESDWGVIGAGGIFTSVTDLYKWELALKGNKILNEIEKARMYGARVPSGSIFDYAYGWRAQKSPRGTPIIWASGLEPEFSAMFQRYPDENVTVIFLTNNSLDGFPYRDVLVIPGAGGTIERIVFGREYTLPPWFMENKPGALDRYAGTYQTSDGAEFVVSIDKNALRVAPRSQAAADLLIPPMTETPAPDYAKYHEQIEKGIKIYQSGNKDEAYKQIAFDGEKLEKKYGRFLGIERMVTLPVVRSKGTHRATTYAELKFERAETVSYRWHWYNGELYEQHQPKLGKQLTILPPFRQQTADEFVTYHIFLSMPLKIKFAVGADGRVNRMSFVNPRNVPVTAAKIKT